MNATVQQVELPSAEDMVRQYLALRDYVKAQDDEHKKRMAPYTAAMEALEAGASMLMMQTKQRALSTNVGTAFYSTSLSVKCADRETWLDFVANQGAWEGLTSHVSKEFVEQWMDSHDGQPPPGVEVNRFQKVQFRKA